MLLSTPERTALHCGCAHRRCGPLLGLLVAGGLGLAVVGCSTNPVGGGRAPETPELEPNDTFNEARKASFGSGRTARLAGSIDSLKDLDVFDLGAMEAGDRLTVNLESSTEGLDASIAVFDEELNLFADNDDEDLSAGLLDPLVVETIRHGGERYFLVVGHTAFRDPRSPETGDYRVTVRVDPGTQVPAPKSQAVFFNFEGAELESDLLLVKEVRPFEAALIDPIYEGEDDVIKEGILETALENFEGFDVVIIADPAELPPEGQYSTVMFGSLSVRAFGISEAVDHYNADQGDMSVIFTESFEPTAFVESTPSAEELAVAIGNIAVHEVGHLLGLNHVNDATALMDAASPADMFLADQDFKTAPLSGDILPIGYQDAPLLLSEIVGLLEGYSPPERVAPPTTPGPRLKRQYARSWCGTCNRKLGH